MGEKCRIPKADSGIYELFNGLAELFQVLTTGDGRAPPSPVPGTRRRRGFLSVKAALDVE
jgi:hypothetical protein